MQDELLIKKVQKLLALATSSNENEANVAAQKAQELIVKYNIDMQQLDSKDFEYQWHELTDEPYLRMHQKFICPLLNQYFFVRAVLKPYPVGGRTQGGNRKFRTKVEIAGTATNVIIADYIFNYLSEVYQRLWLVYKKEKGLDEKSRQAYYHGLTLGLQTKLEETRKQSEEYKAQEMMNAKKETVGDSNWDENKEHAEAMALVVVKKDMQLDKFIGKTRTHKSQGFTKDDQAVADGVSEGKKINVSRPVDHKASGPTLKIGK